MPSKTPSAPGPAASPPRSRALHRRERRGPRRRAPTAAALATAQEQPARNPRDRNRLTATTATIAVAGHNTSDLPLQWLNMNQNQNPKVGTLFQFLQTPYRAWVCSTCRRTPRDHTKTACILSICFKSSFDRQNSGPSHLLRLYVHKNQPQPNLPIATAMESCPAWKHCHWGLQALKTVAVVWDVVYSLARIWTFPFSLSSHDISPAGQCHHRHLLLHQ